MALEIGQEAPDFTLVNENNEEVTLSKLRGNPVVLVFYTFDFSGICTNELCEIRDGFPNLSSLGAQVFGISRDSRFAHAAFKEQFQLPHSLLADVKGEVARSYDTWNEAVGAAERQAEDGEEQQRRRHRRDHRLGRHLEEAAHLLEVQRIGAVPVVGAGGETGGGHRRHGLRGSVVGRGAR